MRTVFKIQRDIRVIPNPSSLCFIEHARIKTYLIHCANTWVKMKVIFNHNTACNKLPFPLSIRRFKQLALFHKLSGAPTFRYGHDYSVIF